jgi:hypothetical protein
LDTMSGLDTPADAMIGANESNEFHKTRSCLNRQIP